MKKYKAKEKTEAEEVTESSEKAISNYVTVPPSRLKPKKRVKNIVTEMKKKRQKRRKVNSSSRIKTQKKHSNMQVRGYSKDDLSTSLYRCTGRNDWRELQRIFSVILCSERRQRKPLRPQVGRVEGNCINPQPHHLSTSSTMLRLRQTGVTTTVISNALLVQIQD